MKVDLSDRAKARLREIQSYLNERNTRAAARTIARILTTVGHLEDNPSLGRNYDGRTRVLTVPRVPYRIHYRVDEDAGVVNVITIAHSSQLPPSFGG